MMNATAIKVYEIFKNRFSEKEAETVVTYFEEKTADRVDQLAKTLATQADIFTVREEVACLKLEIANTKTEIIRWLIVTLTAFAALIVAVIKLT